MSERTLPPGWAWTTIGEITQSVEKVRPRENPNTEFVYIDISSIDNTIFKIVEPKHYIGSEAPSRARQLVHANDVLFSTVRTYLMNIAMVPAMYDGQIASTGFSVLRSEDGISAKYLFYYCLTPEFLNPLEKLQRGTSYPAVRDGDVRAQSFPLPPLSEQHRIVAEIEKQLTRLDAGVAALRRAQAKLRRYKAAVLKAACEGRLVPQDPADEPAAGLLQRILTERRQRWEAEQIARGQDPKKLKYKEPAPPDTLELPELPEGWVWASVAQLAESIQYGHTESAQSEPIGPKFLRITDIQDGHVNWDTVPYCKCSDEEHEKYRLSPGNIVFARTGATTGKSYLIKDCPDAVFASYLIRLSFSESIDYTYFAEFLDSPMYWSQIMSVRKGSAQPGVNSTILATLKVPLPPLVEQHRIVAEVERRLSVVEEMEAAAEANLKRAGRLRQAVLKRAFEGKLVPQDPSDEPATVLLERIRAKREKRGTGDKPAKKKNQSGKQLKLPEM
jgi:type I restriction enzyme S subunit